MLNDSFILFEGSNWTANEELTLLNGLLDYGNFNTIVKQLKKRTLREVKQHYDFYYLQRNGSELLPTFSKCPKNSSPKPVIPFKFSLTASDEPPRHASNSISYHNLAGYNPARSDFELEYDSNAEDLVSNLNYNAIDPQHPLHKTVSNLQCTIVQSYNRRLWERQRRKIIIRNHGLILMRKTIASFHRYDATVTKKVCERMCRFMQFYKGIQFDFLMEGLHRVGELRKEISRYKK